MPKDLDLDLDAIADAVGAHEVLKELVLTFNNIPRSYMISDGHHANHWHFAIRKIAAGEVLHIVNPDSRTTHTEGPVDVFSMDPLDKRAAAVFALLLKAFVESICNTFTPPSAPWSWGTQDEVLAKAVGAYMTIANVRKGLRRISFGDEDNIKIEQEVWLAEQERLRLIAKIGCKKCKRLPQGRQTFNRCSGCKEVQYCSKDCQRADWTEHKKFCQILRIAASETWIGTTSTEAALDGITYHIRNWAILPEVQALAKKMGLKLPAKYSRQIIRRLVLTGNDTEQNLVKFFGPRAVDEDQLERMRNEERLEALMKPKKGCYNYVMAISHNLDVGLSEGALNLREASEEEEADLDTIKDLQERIRRYMGSRLNRITTDDMEVILLSLYGCEDWECEKRLYYHALNSMDLGYPEGYNPCVLRGDMRTRRHYYQEVDCDD